MGSSACFHMARRGAKVLGLEQFRLGHDRGSSHGQSRMIRLAYYEHPDYVPLLRRAYELWDELESLSGQKLFYRTGGVYAGPPAGELISGSMAAARLHQLPHESLSPAALRERFPMFHLPRDWAAMYEPSAGFLQPELAVVAAAQLARQNGADIHEGEAALGWKEDGDALLVSTAVGEYRARKLIVCGGAWSERLLPDLGVRLIVTRQVMGWVKPVNPKPFQLGMFPVWATENPDCTLQYGFPILPGESAMKVAWHGVGAPTDPDRVDRATSGADAATFLPILPHLLPDAFEHLKGPAERPDFSTGGPPCEPNPITDMRVCLYTNSPDHHFIIDRLPSDPRITLACGFSGHGFKFASVVGEILTELTVEGKSRLPAEFLGLKRFRQGSPRRTRDAYITPPAGGSARYQARS